MHQKNNKKIDKKNYIILAVIIFITIIVVFYARSWYITAKEYNENISVIQSVAIKINENEIENHVLDNPRAIIYISSGQNQNIKSFEKEIKKLIEKNNLNDYVLYINKDEISDQNNLEEALKRLAKTQKIKDKISNESEVSMYLFENGKIKYIITDANKQTPSEIEKTLKRNGMIDHE